MPKAVRQMLQSVPSYDEPDRMPANISITYFDLFLYVFAIVGHLVDLALDINVAVRYSLAKKMVEFWWTLAFILLPALVTTLVSVRMYVQDKQQDSISNEVTKRKWLRVFILVLQLAPVLRFADALMYAVKSRRAARRHDEASQRRYYGLMLKEDSDAALLRIFECFLEAAPQQLLQTSLLLRQDDHLAVHQGLSICSSVLGAGWCLAAYQRAVRFAQRDKHNVRWPGSALQTLWHFLVTMSRVVAIASLAYLFPLWSVVAAACHISVMAIWLQFLDRSPFCSNNPVGQIFFSVALGAVYLFTYILPVEGRTRYRYAVFYSVCLAENTACAALWYVYTDSFMQASLYFHPVLVLCVVPYLLGIVCMLIYYAFLHPNGRRVCEGAELKIVDPIALVS